MRVRILRGERGFLDGFPARLRVHVLGLEDHEDAQQHQHADGEGEHHLNQGQAGPL